MAGQTRQSSTVWVLARRQHGLITRAQLLELGFSRHAISHRLARGRLHAVRRGVYVVGNPNLDRHARWMAAVLYCGSDALPATRVPRRFGEYAITEPVRSTSLFRRAQD